MAKSKSRSNPKSRRVAYAYANRPKVVGTLHNISQGSVDWFYSPEESLRRRAVLRGLVKRKQLYKNIRRAALGAVLLMSEDRRRWNPDRVQPAASVGGPARHRLSISPLTRSKRLKRSKTSATLSSSARTPFPTASVAFSNPSKVAICIRRKRRREVILATGQGGGGSRRAPRRNAYSGVSC